ncbi:MAG TPA: VWA domain-containing protein [Chthoniobacterales bacterium]|jgi:Ca-activated chloride channel family protein
MNMNLDDPKLTAYALDELTGAEKEEIETAIAAAPEAQEFVREQRLLTGNLRAEYAAECESHPIAHANIVPLAERDEPWSLSHRLALAAGIALCACLGAIAIGTLKRSTLVGESNLGSASRLSSAQVLQTPVEGVDEFNESNVEAEAALPPSHARTSQPDEFKAGALLANRSLDAKLAPGTAAGRLAIENFRREAAQPFSTARYGNIEENPFLAAVSNPLSTFSIDVDTASYSNMRRFIESGSLPPKDAVRIEEMINYFTYHYPQPNDSVPFSVNLDAASCPWAQTHRLVRIGLKGREIPNEKRPASNLVFLLDVSGSMEPSNRLPLIKQAMRLLVDKLGENDRVAIVVYAGASGLVLPSITGDHKERILDALESLQAGGSTNGAQGIELAYQTATEHFIKGGVNRVILATDGDFNVGTTSEGDLVRLVQEKARSGVFLSVLGVGDDNLNDSMMQKLADKGNGNYAYLDSVEEARKVLVRQINGTLVTIAKDVKIQVEFNPARVASYRLIGYEKRLLRKEDFNNDKIDAGEIGAGHTVTALYEVVPVGTESNPAASVPPVDPLRYQPTAPEVASLRKPSSPEMLTVKLRYKEPAGDTSKLIERPFVDSGAEFASAPPDLKFAAAVAEFGMLLRDSEYKGDGSFSAIAQWAQQGLGDDIEGYRAGFIRLIRKAEALKKGS